MLDLRIADFIRLCRQPGCPLCAARRQAEQRYIKGVLGEGLRDGSFRATLRRSLGFCSEHAWRFQNEPKVEREELAWIRAVAFFAGEAVEAKEVPVSQHRRQALAIFQDYWWHNKAVAILNEDEHT
jgi:hypothetical protein